MGTSRGRGGGGGGGGCAYAPPEKSIQFFFYMFFFSLWGDLFLCVEGLFYPYGVPLLCRGPFCSLWGGGGAYWACPLPLTKIFAGANGPWLLVLLLINERILCVGSVEQHVKLNLLKDSNSYNSMLLFDEVSISYK